MKCKGNKKSKKQKLSLKYNVAKRVREHRRRVRKEAKKLGLKKLNKKDPGIPNTWPFKAQLLAELEAKKEAKDAEIAKNRAKAKHKSKKNSEEIAADRKRMLQEKDVERRQRRLEEATKSQAGALRKVLTGAGLILHTLDARDPAGCRCAALEAYAREKNIRLVFVLTKADLVPPQVLAAWLQALAKEGPTVAVAAEAGREGVPDLLRMLGRSPSASCGPQGATAEVVGVVGYPNTGKQSLSKAMRRECGGLVKWLMDPVARLRAEAQPKPLEAAATLHLAIRQNLPKGEAKGEVAEPIAVLRHIMERTTAQAVMRRFRLPVFEGADGLVAAYGKEKALKNKKGKDLSAEGIAKKLVADIQAAPGMVCTPPEAAASAGELWGAHAASRSILETVMSAQAQTFAARPPSPVDGALQVRTGGPGPSVDLAAALVVEDEDVDCDSDMEGDSDDEGGEEGEEEEMCEGDEEEMSGDEDEEM
jgi:nuclear GTP-binding protein